MVVRHDTVVIGGGQAGLAMSAVLRDCGRDHVVLERSRVAERWRSERWDSLRFQFPNWSIALPGFRYTGSGPRRVRDRCRDCRVDQGICGASAGARTHRGGVASTRGRGVLNHDEPMVCCMRGGRGRDRTVPAAANSIAGLGTARAHHPDGPDALPRPGWLTSRFGPGDRCRGVGHSDCRGVGRRGPHGLPRRQPAPAHSTPVPRPRCLLVAGSDGPIRADDRHIPGPTLAAAHRSDRSQWRLRHRSAQSRRREARTSSGPCSASPAPASSSPATPTRY